MTKILNHINTYQSEADYQNDNSKNFPNVSYIVEDDIVVFEVIRYEEEYFTIESLEDDNAVVFKLSSESGTPSASSAKTISVSTDDGETWTDYTSTANGTTIATLNMGGKVLIKGNNNTYYEGSGFRGGYNHFTASKEFDVNGNIMSLIYGDNFKEQYSFPSGTTYNFGSFFISAPVVSAENLILPVTTLTNYCYGNMFDGCTSLTTAPALPATTLANYCYTRMFDGCTSLVNAPELPATTMAQYCYYFMFQGCTNLVNAPSVLPATTLANYCYEYMFQNCTSLVNAPELPATTMATSCYQNMFNGCTSLTTAPELPATTLAIGCYLGMFSGCTSLTTAPELPATTLAQYCYRQMFYECTSIVNTPELPSTTLASGCYSEMFSHTNVLPDCTNIDFASKTVLDSGGFIGLFAGTKVTDSDLERILPKNANGKYYLPVTTLNQSCYWKMFNGCTSLTTAPVLPARTLERSCYVEMFSGCTSLTTAPALPATTLADRCYNSMFYGCTSLVNAPALPATELETNCYFSMFSGCTSLTTAPVLPARTLVSYCYNTMFQGCTNLKYIKAMFTTTPSASNTNHWVSGVASSGTFVKYNGASWNVTGVNGVPSGWTVQKAYS